MKRVFTFGVLENRKSNSNNTYRISARKLELTSLKSFFIYNIYSFVFAHQIQLRT